MSTRRRTPGVYCQKQPQGADGERLCSNCRGPMPKDKRKFNCSKQCSVEWMRKTSPGIMRQAIFERDRGICASCGADTVAEYQSARPPMWRHIARGTGHLWQADHITPVIEGGGECGIEGYRTLCTDCHKSETAALRKRMSQRRREAIVLPLLDDPALCASEGRTE